MVDLLIVGQGIAGSVLAITAIQRGLKVKVVDSGFKESSSYAAAGLINPITGRKHNLTWNAEALWQVAFPFYQALEQKLDTSFFHETPLYFPISDVKDLNTWAERQLEPDYQPFIERLTAPFLKEQLTEHVKAAVLRKCGYLDSRAFLTAVKHYLVETGLLIPEAFQYDQLKYAPDVVKYSDLTAKWVVFAEGSKVSKNPFFQSIALRPAKGHILELEPAPGFNYIINKNGWYIPKPTQPSLLGSTFEHKDLSQNISDEQVQKLKERADKLLTYPGKVSGVRVGVRPATFDRKPIVGSHPVHKRLVVFNGLGAKGVTQAPWLARHLIDHLIDFKDLLPDVSIGRPGAFI